jgi:putative alpha-1,2-mannosidase
VDTNARGSWPNFLYEDDLWTYSLYAPHDVRRLIAISGGEKTFLQRMWTFFFREHFDMTNEPGFLTPMLFHWVGRPDLSANALIDAINKNFSETRSGFPGNDDSGAMSAWYVFQTMGFYPNAGQDFYLIGAPHLPEVVLHLGEGKDLRIVTENADPQRLNRYIQSATWNGEPLKNNWFRHAMIVQGGTLKFVLGSEPGDWGRTPPPSLSDGAACGSH